MFFDPYTESVLTNIGINIVLTLSLYFPLAVGQLSIAQVGFMAIGAHLATALTLYLHAPFAVALLAAGLLPWLFGAVLGHMLRRLQGLILAFATFAFMEIVQVFFLKFRPTGSAQGMKGIPPLTQPWHVWAFVLLLVLVFCRLRHSRFGRAMMAIKDDEVVADALGVATRERGASVNTGKSAGGLRCFGLLRVRARDPTQRALTAHPPRPPSPGHAAATGPGADSQDAPRSGVSDGGLDPRDQLRRHFADAVLLGMLAGLFEHLLLRFATYDVPAAAGRRHATRPCTLTTSGGGT